VNQVANCLRHKRYETERSARIAARVMRGRVRGIAAWPCKEGGIKHWHVGRGKRR
jgi:hypothetical protein